MRRQDLLDQRRAGARNADDQDGLIPQPGVDWRRSLVREYAQDGLDTFVLARRIPLHPATSRSIGGPEHLEGLRVLTLALQGLRKTEAEQLAITMRQILPRQRALQRSNVGGVEADHVEIRQPEPAFGIGGLAPQHFAKPGHGGIDLAQVGLRPGQREPGGYVRGFELERAS